MYMSDEIGYVVSRHLVSKIWIMRRKYMTLNVLFKSDAPIDLEAEAKSWADHCINDITFI